MRMRGCCRIKAAGALDVDQLRSDWIGMVEYVQAARPRSNAMQSKRVLEEMLPFVRPDPVPPALQHPPAPAASTPTQEGACTIITKQSTGINTCWSWSRHVAHAMMALAR